MINNNTIKCQVKELVVFAHSAIAKLVETRQDVKKVFVYNIFFKNFMWFE